MAQKMEPKYYYGDNFGNCTPTFVSKVYPLLY